MKSIWKGSISFGLVNIPVKMFSATQSQTLDLDMLRKGDLCEVKFRRVCKDDNKEIPYENIVKGYKYEGGDYVVLTDKDFASAYVEKSNTIDLIHFVNEEDIDIVYYEKPYYLEPEKSGTKSYTLLMEAVKKSKKVGVARFVLKNREHIAVIRSYKDVMVLNQIRFQDEIRSYEDLNIPKPKEIGSKEIELAISLIEQLSFKFDLKEFKDTYIRELKKIIALKAKGKPPAKRTGKTAKPTNVKSLMTLLKASVKKKAA